MKAGEPMYQHRSPIQTFAVACCLLAAIALSGCSKKEGQAAAQPAAAASGADAAAQPGGAGPAGSGAAPGQPAAGQQAAGSSAASGMAGTPAPVGGSAASPGRTSAPVARQITIPAGTPVAIRTISTLSTKTAKPGERFEATLAEDLEVNNYVVATKGSTAYGEVTVSDPGGRVKGLASISVAVTSITDRGGATVPFRTRQLSQVAKSSKKKDAVKVGIASGIGAAIGAIAGGGKGAAIGAGAGAAGGGGLVMATRGDPAVIPSETVLTFRLAQPVTVTAKK